MSVVQQAVGGVSWANSLTITLPAATQPGATLIVGTSNQTATTPTITDAAGNAWVLVGSTADEGATSQRAGHVFVCQDAAPVTEVTIGGVTGRHTATILELGPTVGAPRVDVTSNTAGTVTTTAGGEALLIGFTYSTAPPAGSTPSGWTRLPSATFNASSVESAWSATQAGTVSPSFGPGDFGLVTLAFDGPAAPPQAAFQRRVDGAWAPVPASIRRANEWVPIAPPSRTPDTPTGALAVAQQIGTVSPNRMLGDRVDVQWNGSTPTRSGGIYTSGRPALAGADRWRSEFYLSTSDHSSGRLDLYRYERYVLEVDVNMATGHPVSPTQHDVIAQLIGRSITNTWPGPPMALTYQQGTYRMMSNPTPFGPVAEATSVAGRLDLGNPGEWNTFLISVYLDGPGEGSIHCWVNGELWVDDWRPPAGTWYTDETHGHSNVFPKIGAYGASDGAVPAKTIQHRNVRFTRHNSSGVQTWRSVDV